jgi:asparagine synthase (glutamine-hydrolysing)
MCGIAGLFNLDGAPAAPDSLRGMIRMLAHRGPDDTGFHVEHGVGLAHARLSIIDLAGGHQPMCNEDSSLWITFNGEIFNYLELREELLGKGHKFVTRSDTEVILHLYEEKGEDCVQYLNGQWAFAIWDNQRRRLFLSRDRLGVRPLFYTQANNAFIFGSEIKAIFANPEVAREIDISGLDEVFTYWCTIPPTTLFRNIQELPPGHSMTVDADGLEVRPYWDHQFEGPSAFVDRSQEQAYADQLLELLIDSTQIRLRSDVPVGAYLSGGLDSTLTTALVKKFTSAKLRTFSISFDDAEFDESSFQNEAVRFLDTEHQDIRCTKNQIAEVFPDVIWHTEKNSSAHGSSPPLSALSAGARKRIQSSSNRRRVRRNARRIRHFQRSQDPPLLGIATRFQDAAASSSPAVPILAKHTEPTRRLPQSVLPRQRRARSAAILLPHSALAVDS